MNQTMKYFRLKLLVLSLILGTVSYVQARSVIEPKIHFASGSAEIRPQSTLILNDTASIIKNNEKMINKVIIEGYADAKESTPSKQKLSERRAQAVREYLIKKGVSANLLEVVGYGDNRLLYPGKTEQERARNRRVEFKFKEKTKDDGI